jgi:hypothetical protein
MLVFLAADTARYEELQAFVREYLAWKYVRDNGDGVLNLTSQQREQATWSTARGTLRTASIWTNDYAMCCLAHRTDTRPGPSSARRRLCLGNPHAFRKTVATLIGRERGDHDASAQLGHSGTAVTRKHYIEKAVEAPDLTVVLDQLG